MSAKTHNFRIGLFALAAVALLVIGLLAFGAKSYFEKKTRFETAVPGEVYGLSVGSPVELRGVPIGKVTAINFAWNIYRQTQSRIIIVEFEVEDGVMPVPPGPEQNARLKTAIDRGLRAMVKSQGITGTSMLALETIDPKENPPPPIDFTPRYSYVPNAPGQFTRMLEALEKTLDHVQQLDFASIGEGVTNVLGEVRALSQKLNQVDLQSVATNANSLLVEAKQAAVNLEATLNEVRTTLKAMKLDTVSKNADELLAGLRDTNVKLQTVLDHAGDVPLQDTVGDLRQAVETLNEVLLELKRYPSGFIFGQPPPPAKVVRPPQK